MDVDERIVRRIIATLLALAVLAERAAVRSFLVRWIVLVALRRAEGIATRYAAEEAGIDGAFFEDEDRCGSSPADAALLAWRLRWIAAFLQGLLEADCLRHAWTPGVDGPRRPGAAYRQVVALATPACAAPRPWDTS